MEWLDIASKNFSVLKDQESKEKKLHSLVKMSYPSKVDELWGSFKEIHEAIVTKFEGKGNFFSNPNTMQSVIGDVVIKGSASQTEVSGGYYGVVTFEVTYLNSNRSGSIHFDRLLLGQNNGVPKWVYRDVVNDQMSDIPFEKEDLEKVYKNALSIYL